MITCSRRIEFDAAHRIPKHESKCKMLHGHRYVIEANFTAKELDNLGRIIDFGVVKEVLGKWIDDNFDHNTILWKNDQELGKQIAAQTGQEIFYLDEIPTAENIAKFLFEEICPKLFADKNVKCTKIRLYETPNCYVDVK